MGMFMFFDAQITCGGHL